MALAWFRHWFAQRIVSDRGHNADDGGYALYKAIGAGGDAYMDKAVLSQFQALFPITKKALNVLENHICEIKECMSEWVEKSNLLKSNCQVNVEKYPVGYITCVDFENGDFPWLKDEREAMANKSGKRPGGNDIAQRNLDAAKRHQEQMDVDEGAVDDDEDDLEAVREPKRARMQ